jgi:hypothetical protein
MRVIRQQATVRSFEDLLMRALQVFTSLRFFRDHGLGELCRLTPPRASLAGAKPRHTLERVPLELPPRCARVDRQRRRRVPRASGSRLSVCRFSTVSRI